MKFKRVAGAVLAQLLGTLALGAQEFGMEDLVKQVSSRNYQVMDHALKVYQAKDSVSAARGELIPSLNIWRIIGAVLDPVNFISQDFAPFLVPANWFRLRQAESLYLAEKEGYRAVWANQLYSSKTLYLQILSDSTLATMIEGLRSHMIELRDFAIKRERLGGLRPGLASDLRIRILTLDDDLKRLHHLLGEEQRLLLYDLSLPLGTLISLRPVALPNLLESKILDLREIEWRVLASSPEILQHIHLLHSLSRIKGEVRYSLLGLASNHRGVAGGVFDSYPIPSGLGFASAPGLRIAEAERQRFVIQLRGIEETMRRDLSSVVSLHNLEIEAYPGLIERSQLANNALVLAKKRLMFGEDLDVQFLGETFKTYLTAESALFQAQYRFASFRERLMRLTFNGDYQLEPAVLESRRP